MELSLDSVQVLLKMMREHEIRRLKLWGSFEAELEPKLHEVNVDPEVAVKALRDSNQDVTTADRELYFSAGGPPQKLPEEQEDLNPLAGMAP